MKTASLSQALVFGCVLVALGCSGLAALPQRQSGLATEPGTLSLEGMRGMSVRLTVAKQSYIYYSSALDRVLGTMNAGTPVTLVAMSDTAYRVRGRAAHGDTAGWMHMTDVLSQDPDLPKKLKALYERQIQIGQLIADHQVALGMTADEVEQSLGKPTRKNTKITLAGREERFEYAIFEKVPQVMTGRDAYGQLVQSVIYVKVETGCLAVSFKNGLVDTIEETKGQPLGGQGIKIVPPPIILR
ncbi:MAG: hypothetical protein JNJ83_24700 [Verrucomicrobiaceae bacterium]|nr:hypothetical protein [Verrucomicrobiaceae bacterium]